MMQQDGVFSIIDTYLELVREGQVINGERVDGDRWRDLGKLEQVHEAAGDLKRTSS